MSALNVTDANFAAEVLQSPVPVLVDFWAEWCGPCRMVGPIVEEIATELQGKLKVVKINVDDSPDLAGQYHVMSIPTLFIFKNGQPVEQIVGALPKEHLLNKIKPKL